MDLSPASLRRIMIAGYRDEDTKRFAEGKKVAKWEWRICFKWPKNASGPLNVEIVDYH